MKRSLKFAQRIVMSIRRCLRLSAHTGTAASQSALIIYLWVSCILIDSLLDMADGLEKSWNCSVRCNTFHESIIGAHASTTSKSQLITVLVVAGLATLAAFQGVAARRNACTACWVCEARVSRKVAIGLFAKFFTGWDVHGELLDELLADSHIRRHTLALQLALSSIRKLGNGLLHEAEILDERWDFCVGCDALHESIIGAHACTTCQGQLIAVFLHACLCIHGSTGCRGTSRNAIPAGRISKAGQVAIGLLAQLFACWNGSSEKLCQLLLDGQVHAGLVRTCGCKEHGACKDDGLHHL